MSIILMSILAVVVVAVIAIVALGKDKEPEPVVKDVKKEEIEEEVNVHEGQSQSFLTGEWINSDLTGNRPIAVMIENTKQSLPQYGLSYAGVIYEAPVEGSYTRLMALMENYDALDKIGNVRSCRPYYVYIAAEFDAIYVHYGQSVHGLEVLKTGIADNLSGLDGSVSGKVFFRTTDKKAPHNAYASASGIKAGIEKKGYRTRYEEGYTGHYRFAADDEPVLLTEGSDAAVVQPYYFYNKPYFIYNSTTGLYERYQFGAPQIDADDIYGSQLAVKNIIYQNVPSSIYQGTDYLNIPLNGSGSGKYFTNGKCIDITWKKDSDRDITRYYNAAGEEIVLNQGTTWVCLIQNSYAEKSKIYATVEEFQQ